jgi:hypothetical protein
MVIDNAFIREIHPEMQETKHLYLQLNPLESNVHYEGYRLLGSDTVLSVK